MQKKKKKFQDLADSHQHHVLFGVPERFTYEIFLSHLFIQSHISAWSHGYLFYV